MSTVNDRPPTKAPELSGTIVSRPRQADAIGKALAATFGSRAMIPTEWIATLRRLDTAG